MELVWKTDTVVDIIFMFANITNSHVYICIVDHNLGELPINLPGRPCGFRGVAGRSGA